MAAACTGSKEANAAEVHKYKGDAGPHGAGDVELRLAEELGHKDVDRVVACEAGRELQRVGASGHLLVVVVPAPHRRVALPRDVCPVGHGC
jgi:hypothetical protein